MDQQKPKSNLIWFIIIIVVLAGGFLAWYFLSKNKSSPSTASTSATTSATTSSTANWATYSDTTNGFSFKYPSDWQKQTNAPAVDFFPQPPGDAQRLEIIVYNDSITDEKAKIDQQDQNINIYHDFTATTVNGKTGYISKVITIDNHNYQTVLIDMDDGQTIYIDAEGDPVQQLNTILSTFNFTK